MNPTIYALSSGAPPAAVAIVRISGPDAGGTLLKLTGRLPAARRASLSTLRDPTNGEELDRGLMLWFPGPLTATGEDLAELHLHGGRAVVARVLTALNALALAPAGPGDFTRRAFENGRIDLAEAEGLSDLLFAETEAQRRSALAVAGGVLSAQIEAWQARLLGLSAQVEALLDFSDEDDVDPDSADSVAGDVAALAGEIAVWLDRPSAERLRDGVRVVFAGPPNAGKSSLLNALVGRDAAIVSPRAGTTRDAIDVPIAIGGRPFVLTDTAGLHDGTGDDIEAIGIAIAEQRIAEGDIILWLGDEALARAGGDVIHVRARADLPGRARGGDIAVSVLTGEGLDELIRLLLDHADRLLPRLGEVAINERQRVLLAECLSSLSAPPIDLLVLAEALRTARLSLDRITGRAGTEDMLDALFGRFCIGK